MSVRIARTRSELFQLMREIRSESRDLRNTPSVGFVPTMGALHRGHASLIEHSVRENSTTVVSVFVNPKQFGPKEDLSKYPRTFEQDLETCERSGAQILFAPSVDEVYPDGFKTTVAVSEMDGVLCGAFRPGHFDGVCTVVLLLLNLVRADKAYLGMKDFQQFTILQRMVEDLAHPTQLIPVPTVRDLDGLALSSRNKFLDSSARQTARTIPEALKLAARMFIQGERNRETLLGRAVSHLSNIEGLELQYCELVKAKDLTICNDVLESDSVLAVAAFVTGADGIRTRLIDNVLLSEEPRFSFDLNNFAAKTFVEG